MRSEHAARAGKVFSWDEPPEGGHPGEDFGCRCWAEPVAENEGAQISLNQIFDHGQHDWQQQVQKLVAQRLSKRG